ncbi:site-specific DNA-methyltransferase [Neisseria meningitidis]|uniref:site-specific DNA-methyltransferase n=1 Tax=Neisseria meningitidis TaxID=487 RepID=UPI0009AB8B6B|nr:site-specific DNA-methyltransferase [Neisseria meningitidis]MCG3358042.1 site-specific DNA-methyltransferase [Neisseria meningitidis]MCL6034278.1 site-specific DNA-methyltransferase [Neisseria meningitidis]MCL6118456.1 site-specific DNA-methyltransferase [Neisseria meningitidis]
MDPPYNTETDSFAYNDKFNRSTWLTFMKNRLEIARELLADDGAIYINLDYHEVHYCKVLMDEIFGEYNFQREIIWRIGWVSGYKTTVSNYIRNHDTILFYSKDYNHLNFNKYYIDNKHFKVLVDLDRATKNTFTKFGINKETAEKILQEINFSNRPERYPLEDVWNANEYDDLNSIAIVSYSGESVSKMLGLEEIKGQKSEKLLKRILEAHTKPNDIVLDFFGGSGTTAAVAHKMNRQYICIEQIDKQTDTIVKRLNKILVNESSGISKAVNWQGGGEFVYAELAPFNETAKQQILACEDSDGIKTLFEGLCERYFLKYNVSINEFSQIIEEPEFQSLPLDEQKQMVLEMLDLNQMYVSLSEMDDEQFADCLNDDDKALSRAFYQSVKNQAEKKDGE